MKRYKLLKDLPFAKAGEEFQLHRGGINDYITLYRDEERIYQFKVGEDVSGMFDEWFEEVEEPKLPKEFFFISEDMVATLCYVSFSYNEETKADYASVVRNYKSVGNFFETRKQAEDYLDYLKAKVIIKKDTKGFKPNWNDTEQIKYSCSYQEDRFTGPRCVKPVINSTKTMMSSLMYFKSEEDIKESLKKHPKEWKTYLTYEQ